MEGGGRPQDCSYVECSGGRKAFCSKRTNTAARAAQRCAGAWKGISTVAAPPPCGHVTVLLPPPVPGGTDIAKDMSEDRALTLPAHIPLVLRKPVNEHNK